MLDFHSYLEHCTGTNARSVIRPLAIDTSNSVAYPILDWISPHRMHASKDAVKVRHCTTVISPAIACIHGTFKICLYSKA